MADEVVLAGIAGSFRRESFNATLLREAQALAPDDVRLRNRGPCPASALQPRASSVDGIPSEGR